MLAVPHSGSLPGGQPGAVRLPDRMLELWAVRGTFPTLDPDGKQLAFAEHFERIMTSDLDGSGQRVIFEPGTRSGLAAELVEGRAVDRLRSGADLWQTLGPGGHLEVPARRQRGSEPDRRLGANNGFPYFSPDGRQIVFRSGRDGNHEIYLMNSDGTNVRRLTDNEATDTMPSFSPDGKQIAFVSTRDGDHEIYTLDLGPDGKPGASRRITHSPGFDTHPVFSPDGKWLVFSSQRGGLNDEEPLITVFNPQPYGELYAHAPGRRPGRPADPQQMGGRDPDLG